MGGGFWGPVRFVWSHLELLTPLLCAKRCRYLPGTTNSGWWLSHPSEKYARQNENFPQTGVKIKNIWNHHLELLLVFCMLVLNWLNKLVLVGLGVKRDFHYTNAWNCIMFDAKGKSSHQNIYILPQMVVSESSFMGMGCFSSRTKNITQPKNPEIQVTRKAIQGTIWVLNQVTIFHWTIIFLGEEVGFKKKLFNFTARKQPKKDLSRVFRLEVSN